MNNASSPLLAQIEALLALADAATPGPQDFWKTFLAEFTDSECSPGVRLVFDIELRRIHQELTAARTALPATLRALKVAVEGLRDCYAVLSFHNAGWSDIAAKSASDALAAITAELSRDVREGRAG